MSNETLAKAITSAADQISNGLLKLGLNGAATPMGAIEMHSLAIKESATEVANALTEIALAIDGLAEAIKKHP